MRRIWDRILVIVGNFSSTGPRFAFLAGLLGAIASPTAYAQAALVKTIDLGSWGGVPVVQSGYPLPSPIVISSPSTVQVPQPAPGNAFSLTGIAVDPVLNRVYVADHASTNVYLIDGATNTVSAAVYTYGFFGNIDGVPPSMGGIMGKAVTNVIANPVTGRWLTLGGFGGGQFTGTTFVEGVATQAMQNGGAWDPVTGDVYGASGYAFFTSQNVKFPNLAASTCNTVAFNPLTLRVYASCTLGYSGGLANIPNNGLISWDGGDPSVQARIGTVPPISATLALQHTAVQLSGIAVNANINRVYVVGASSPSSLDVLDATTNAIVASIPGLPDQSADIMVGPMGNAPLPRPVAINTRTNTVFVLNSVSSTISVIDGRTNTLTGTISIPAPPGAVLNVPVPPNMFLEEVKTGNTYFSAANPAPGSVGTLTSLGGAVSLAVNEATNMLYVASVDRKSVV